MRIADRGIWGRKLEIRKAKVEDECYGATCLHSITAWQARMLKRAARGLWLNPIRLVVKTAWGKEHGAGCMEPHNQRSAAYARGYDEPGRTEGRSRKSFAHATEAWIALSSAEVIFIA